MKKMLLLIVCVWLWGCVSVSYSEVVINEESITTFLTVYPEYINILKGLNKGAISQTAYSEQINDLLAKYSLQNQEWMQLFGKIMRGYSYLQMKKQATALPQMKGVLTSTSLSDEELSAIEKYSAQIKRVMELQQ